MAISYLVSPDGDFVADPSGDIVVGIGIAVSQIAERSEALPSRRLSGSLAAARAAGVLPERRLS